MFPVLVALKLGVMPETGLLLLSSSVIVIVEVAVPLAITEPVPVMLEFAATTEEAINCTEILSEVSAAGVTTVSVFVCAAVEAIVPEA